MDNDTRQAANKRAVDTDELKVAADRVLHPVGNCRCVPVGDSIRDQRHDILAEHLEDTAFDLQRLTGRGKLFQCTRPAGPGRGTIGAVQCVVVRQL